MAPLHSPLGLFLSYANRTRDREDAVIIPSFLANVLGSPKDNI